MCYTLKLVSVSIKEFCCWRARWGGGVGIGSVWNGAVFNTGFWGLIAVTSIIEIVRGTIIFHHIILILIFNSISLLNWEISHSISLVLKWVSIYYFVQEYVTHIIAQISEPNLTFVTTVPIFSYRLIKRLSGNK